MSRFTHVSRVPHVIDIPDELAASQLKYNGEAGRAFIAALPQLTADFLDHWELCPDGPSTPVETCRWRPPTGGQTPPDDGQGGLHFKGVDWKP